MARTTRLTLRALAALVALLAGTLVTPAAEAAAPVTALPTQVSFGSLHVGKTVARSVTLKAAAGQTITHVQSLEGAPFEVATVPAACTAPGPTQCTLTATFSPTRTGVATGSMWVVTCASSTSCSDTYVPLTGTGVAPGTSPAIAFGAAKAGATVTKPFTVRFDAGWFVRYVEFAEQPGPATATFTVPGVPPGVYTDPCGTSPAATSCTMTAAFRARSIGAQSDTMKVHVCKVADYSFCTVLTSKVSGTGTAPATVSPGSLRFGRVMMTSGGTWPMKVTLTAGWRVGSFGLAGVPSAPGPLSDIRHIGTTCTSPTVCIIQIGFRPTQTGSYAADAYLQVCNTAGICLYLPKFRITGTVYQSASRTAVRSSAATARLGSPLTLTGTVTPEPQGLESAQGTMTFYDKKSVVCADVPVSRTGVATCTAPVGGTTGSHAIKAVYSGNVRLKASTSAAVYVRVTG